MAISLSPAPLTHLAAAKVSRHLVAQGLMKELLRSLGRGREAQAFSEANMAGDRSWGCLASLGAGVLLGEVPFAALLPAPTITSRSVHSFFVCGRLCPLGRRRLDVPLRCVVCVTGGRDLSCGVKKVPTLSAEPARRQALPRAQTSFLCFRLHNSNFFRPTTERASSRPSEL